MPNVNQGGITGALFTTGLGMLKRCSYSVWCCFKII